MLKVILTKGLPGSGKSTWAKKMIDDSFNSFKRINNDELRLMFDNGHFSADSEKFITKVREELILLSLQEGKHVILDNTNLAPKHIERISQLIKGKAELQIEDFTNISVDTCIERDLKRATSVGSKVILKMYNQYLKPKISPIEIIPFLPHAVICDLDGTLAILNGRSPYDASTCENDGLNTVVSGLIKNRTVILVSGREDKYYQQTLSFLEKNKIEFTSLFMRKEGDFRKDSIIKAEIFNTHIRGKYNIDFVLDDRNQVVDMWRELGLTCLQVAPGDF